MDCETDRVGHGGAIKCLTELVLRHPTGRRCPVYRSTCASRTVSPMRALDP